MYAIDYNSYRSVTGFNRRVRFLVFHYTALNFSASIRALTGASVSAHYLVPDPEDSSYISAGFKDMRIFNLVDEHERAWHAGESLWAKRHHINDTSIGIEVVNLASDKNGIAHFPPYHPAQIDAIKSLASNILQRYPDITPTNVVGHSDISPRRKSDPGPVFPWYELHMAGVGAWYDQEIKQHYETLFNASLPCKADVVMKLGKYGYDVSAAGSESGYRNVLRAFQLHFRQESYNGVLDAETAAVLYALVEKYFP